VHRSLEVKQYLVKANPLPSCFDSQKIQVSYKVNPGLISGYTIEMGSKFLDESAATELKKLGAIIGLGLHN